MTTEPTLTEKLKSLGYTHRRSCFPGQQEVLRADGTVAVVGDAAFVWAWVHAREARQSRSSPFLSNRLIARLSPLRQGNLRRRLLVSLDSAEQGESHNGTPLVAPREQVVARLERMLGRLAAVAK